MKNGKKLFSLILSLSILANFMFAFAVGNSQTAASDIAIDLSTNVGWSSFWGGASFSDMSGDIMLGTTKQGEYSFANNKVTLRSTANIEGVYWATATAPVIKNVDLSEIRYLRYDIDVKNGNDAWNIQVRNLKLSAVIDTFVIRENKSYYIAFPADWTGIADIQVSVVTNFYGDVVNEVTVNSLVLGRKTIDPSTVNIPLDLSSNVGWSSYWGNTNFSDMSGNIMLGTTKQGEYSFANNKVTLRSTANIGGVYWATATAPTIKNVDLNRIRYLRYNIDVKNGNDAWNIQVRNLKNGATLDTGIFRENKDYYIAFPVEWTGKADLQVSIITNFYGDVVNEVTVNSLTLSNKCMDPNLNPTTDVTNNTGWTSYKGNTNMAATVGKVMLSDVEYGDYSFDTTGLTLKATNDAAGVTWMTVTAPVTSKVDLDTVEYICYDIAAQNSDSKWNIEIKNIATDEVITTGDVLGSKYATLDISAWTGVSDLQVSVTTYYNPVPYTVTFKEIAFQSNNISIKNYKIGDRGSAGTIISNIQPGATVDTFLSNSAAGNGTVFVFTNAYTNTEITGNETIGTGTTVDVTVGGVITKTYEMIIYGDVDGDGAIDLEDLILIRNYLLEAGSLANEFKQAGNLYGESNITLNDLVGLMAYISEAGNIEQNL